MPKYKVLYMTQYDWANSGYKQSEAVNQFSKDYEVEYFAVHPHPFNYERGNNILVKDGGIDYNVFDKLEQYHADCDIIHFKENSGVITGFTDDKSRKFMFYLQKPVVHTFGGSVFRNNHDEIWKNNKQYINAVTVNTPDLLFEDEFELVQFPIDIAKYANYPKDSQRVIIGHFPSNPKSKGSEKILKCLSNASSKCKNIDILVLSGMSHVVVRELMGICHIYIDQWAGLGIYGNAGTEAMAKGCAVLSDTTNDTKGVIAIRDEQQFTDEICKLATNRRYLLECQKSARTHAVQYHSYQTVCRKLENIYNKVLS